MPKTWVVVAESSRAKIFELDNKNTPLKELQGFAHTPARVHEQQLTSDLPGRTHDSHGHGSHKMGSQTSVKDHESMQFARTIGGHLNNAVNKGKCAKLIIMSPPAFLGHLRKQLSPETNKHIVSEIDKNLVRHDAKDIQAHLPYHF
ncbi:MAG: host attachment protein [Gammaproteobacteria bacterium]